MKFFDEDSGINVNNVNQHYFEIRDNRPIERDFIERMFNVAKKYMLDKPKKIKDNATANYDGFHDTIWEMLVLNTLYENGIDIIPKNRARKMIRDQTPDFVIDVGFPIVVEATCPKNSTKIKPINKKCRNNEYNSYGYSLDDTHKDSLIDIINNSFNNKYKKYNKQNNAMIIAINTYYYRDYTPKGLTMSHGVQAVYGTQTASVIIHPNKGTCEYKTIIKEKINGIVVNRFLVGGLENAIGMIYSDTLPISICEDGIINNNMLEFINNSKCNYRFQANKMKYMNCVEYDAIQGNLTREPK